MYSRQRSERSTAAALIVGLATLLVGSVSTAQPNAPANADRPGPAQGQARVQAAAHLPNLDGVWTPLQADVFDITTPKAPPGTRVNAPFTRAYQAKYAATTAKLSRDFKVDPLSECQPLGLLRMMSLAGHYEFAVTPEQTWIFSGTAAGPRSSGAQTRRIYTDGRANLKDDDLFSTYTGNSVGHWEGDTLVVKTVGLNEGMFIDHTGAILSGDATVTERIRLVSPDVLQDQFTIEDKTALTRPWVVTRSWKRLPAGAAVSDDSCLGKRVNPAKLTDAAVARAAQKK